MFSNTTRILTLPQIYDSDGDGTWHTCEIKTLEMFSTYMNESRTLTLSPAYANFGDYRIKCVLHDFNYPSRTTTTYFHVSIIQLPIIVEPPPPPKIPILEPGKKFYLIEPRISKITVNGQVEIFFPAPLA